MAKFHRNPTGPGQYEHHPMTGCFITDSSKTNQPRFTFGLKQDFYVKKPPTLSKVQGVDYLMRDSPGAGEYSPDLCFK